MAGGAARAACEHGAAVAVATAARLGNGEGKSERGRAREWEWERATTAPPFTPSASQTGQANVGKWPPHGAHGLAVVGHDALGRPIQIGRQDD